MVSAAIFAYTSIIVRQIGLVPHLGAVSDCARQCCVLSWCRAPPPRSAPLRNEVKAIIMTVTPANAYYATAEAEQFSTALLIKPGTRKSETKIGRVTHLRFRDNKECPPPRWSTHSSDEFTRENSKIFEEWAISQ